jgi:AcrR family transcriptional regulator
MKSMQRALERKTVEKASGAQATRLELMLAAERQFGEHGIGGVSLRAICQEAGQRNISCVQYHFGDRDGLLRAILEFRETQLEPLRKVQLETARAAGRLGDLRTLLRIQFEPYARMFTDGDNISYIKLLASYVSQVRPQGLVVHPADDPEQHCPALFEVTGLLRKQLSFLDRKRFDRRAEAVAAMFCVAFIQFAAAGHSKADKRLLFDDTMEMLAAAISVPPPAK